MRFLIFACLITIPTLQVEAQATKTVSGRDGGWILELTTSPTVSQCNPADVKVRLSYRGRGSNEIREGGNATVTLTVLDKDPGRDDVIWTETLRFTSGDRVEASENFSRCLKRDVVGKTDLYSKVKITVGLRQVGDIRPLGSRKFSTKVMKVKITK